MENIWSSLETVQNKTSQLTVNSTIALKLLRFVVLTADDLPQVQVLSATITEQRVFNQHLVGLAPSIIGKLSPINGSRYLLRPGTKNLGSSCPDNTK